MLRQRSQQKHAHVFLVTLGLIPGRSLFSGLHLHGTDVYNRDTLSDSCSEQWREGPLQNNKCHISVSPQSPPSRCTQVQRKRLPQCNPSASHSSQRSWGYILPSPAGNASDPDLNSHPRGGCSGSQPLPHLSVQQG